jgi:hypothetical protein
MVPIKKSLLRLYAALHDFSRRSVCQVCQCLSPDFGLELGRFPIQPLLLFLGRFSGYPIPGVLVASRHPKAVDFDLQRSFEQLPSFRRLGFTRAQRRSDFLRVKFSEMLGKGKLLSHERQILIKLADPNQRPRPAPTLELLTIAIVAVLLTTSEDFVILVSPSSHEGLGLYGERSRFQVIAKVPFASLGDKRVKRRMETDRDWYLLNTAQKLIQACGRSIRSDSDYATTYLLDRAFGRFYDRAHQFFPPYFKDSLRIDEVDLTAAPLRL